MASGAAHSERASRLAHKERNMTRSQADLDNHANQLNPNNDAYWASRDEDKPADTEPAAEEPSNDD